MSVFENFTRKVSDTAKAAAKKSSELVEVTKLNMAIGSEEDKIEKLYNEIGKLVYSKYGCEEEVDEELKQLCDRIKEHTRVIQETRDKIDELKKVKKCPGCSAELDVEMAFCPKCGTKQEMPQPREEEAKPEETQEAPVEERVSVKTCSDCSAENPADAGFCSECGTKL